LTLIEGGQKVNVPPILFEKLSAEWVEINRAKFAGLKHQGASTLAVTSKEPR
jgi:methionyl-tRNA synthetase